jgi:hypothetical protein
MAGKKIKLEEEAINEILVADTVSELGAEAMLKTSKQQQQQASAEVAITSTGQQIRLCCRLCSSRSQREDKQCARCDVALCVVPCFTEYHTKVNL